MRRAVLVVVVLVLTSACGADGDGGDATPAPAPSATEPSTRPPPPGTVPPTWLGTRPLPTTPEGYGEIGPTPAALRTRRFTLPDSVDPLPGSGFESRIDNPAPDAVLNRSTWEPECPVARDELAWVRVVFVGFDRKRHTGELLVNASVADDIVRAFTQLYRARYPIEQLRVTTKAERDATPTGDGNNTSAFVCRAVRGDDATYSQHAYGLAIDVNPFQNPYVDGAIVLPELASAYTDRTRRAPGMIRPDGPVVRAFASIGWGWGGSWTSKVDLQHFSQNGT